GLQLRHALHLDEAHAARADRRPEPRLVAEDRDLDPGRLRRLDHAGALRHLHAPLVDRDGDELRRAHAHAGTCVTGEWVCMATGASTWSSDELPPNGQPPSSMCAWNSSRNFAT